MFWNREKVSKKASVSKQEELMKAMKEYDQKTTKIMRDLDNLQMRMLEMAGIKS